MDGTNTGTGQHGKTGFGHHRHVDQHAVALGHTQVLQDGGHALHFGVQFTKAVGLLGIGFGGNKNQRILVRALTQMAVHRVVAQIGLAASEPMGKRRMAVVTDLVKRFVPVDQAGLLSPKPVTVFNGTAVKFCIRGHGGLSPIPV